VFLNSVFNSKEAAPYIQTGDGITVLHNEGDVSVEALAAYYEPARSGLYMELRITDLTGSERLSESIVFLRDNGYISDLVISTGKVIVLTVDENTVVVSLFITSFSEAQTVIFDRIVSGDETIIGKWSLLYRMKTYWNNVCCTATLRIVTHKYFLEVQLLK